MYTIIMHKDKTLTTSKRVTLYEGDNLADKIRFLFPQTYNNISLEDCVVRLNYRDLTGKEKSEILVKDKELYKERLSYRFPIDSKFTEFYGDILFDISFSVIDDTDGNGTTENVLFHTESHIIKIKPHLNSIPPNEIIPESSASKILKEVHEIEERVTELEENGIGVKNVVKYVEQELTSEQKEQARINISAADADTVRELSEEIGNLKVGNSVCNYTLKDGDYNVLAINHRGYSTTAPENTIPAYILSKEKGFNYAECDVAFTSDGVAVLLHDATIDRTSNGSGDISSMTYEEVLAYDFGSWKSSAYAGVKIATFEEFIRLCKNIGLHPYIELKSNGSYTEAQIQGLVDIVENYGMKGKVTWISFNVTFLEYVKNYDDTARIGYLANITSTTISRANALKTGKNEVFMDVYSENITEEKVALCIENELPLEIWTVNSQSTITSMNPYISGVTSDNLIAGKVLYDANMTYKAPDVPATEIILDKTSLVFDETGTQEIVVTVKPTNTTDVIVWSSDDETIATVSNGIVTPISKGSCTITVTAGSVSATCEVIVNVEIATYTITRNLSNSVSTSSIETIVGGVAHTEKISADKDYILDNTSVVVKMDGVDISNDVCTGGNITIENVTGNIEITANPSVYGEIENNTLLYNWDFKTSLIDTVRGSKVELLNGNAFGEDTENYPLPTMDSNGIHFTNFAQICRLDEILKWGMKVEVDIGDMTPSWDSINCNARLFMIGKENISQYPGSSTSILMDKGIVYKKGNVGWSIYSGATDTTEHVWESVFSTDKSLFANKTVVLKFGNVGHLTMLIDGEEIVSSNNPLIHDGYARLHIGNASLIANSSTTPYNMTITGLRIYKNTPSNTDSLLYNWDFTDSLVDTVSEQEATLSCFNGTVVDLEPPTQDENGVNFTTQGQRCSLGHVFDVNRTYVFDVAKFDFKGNTENNIRFIMVGQEKQSDYGDFINDIDTGLLIWRNSTTIGWNGYNSDWGSSAYSELGGNTTEILNYFNGKTISIYIDATGKSTLYVDGVSKGSLSINFTKDLLGDDLLCIGNIYTYNTNGTKEPYTSGAQLYDVTISGVRIYQGLVIE